MAGAYVLTPARRAALRRAQLISAQKRRKYGVGYQAKNVVKQKIAIRYTSSQVRGYQNLKSYRSMSRAQKIAAYNQGTPYGKVKRPITAQHRAKVIGKRVGKTALTAGVIGGAVAVGIARHNISGPKYAPSGVRRVKSYRGISQPLYSQKSLGTGPKGKSTIRSRNYRARRR